MQTLTVLGSTGSIGTSTLDVVARHPERYRVHALTASSQIDLMLASGSRARLEMWTRATHAGRASAASDGQLTAISAPASGTA